MVPDGKLFAVPFPLLQDGHGAMLEDRFIVRVLTRPESLFGVSADQRFAKGGKAVLAGGLDYSNGTEKGAEPLPGTTKEVDAIAAILRQDGYCDRSADRHGGAREDAAPRHGDGDRRASGDPRRLPRRKARAAPIPSMRCGRATSCCRSPATGNR